jgi:ribosomal protein L14E/L6E/L27E
MALPRSYKSNGISNAYFSRARVLTVADTQPQVNVAPEIVTQYKNHKGKQIHVKPTKDKEPSYEQKDKKKKRKYLPAERLLLKLMTKETKAQYNEKKMKKITASIRRVLNPKNDEQ